MRHHAWDGGTLQPGSSFALYHMLLNYTTTEKNNPKKGLARFANIVKNNGRLTMAPGCLLQYFPHLQTYACRYGLVQILEWYGIDHEHAISEDITCIYDKTTYEYMRQKVNCKDESGMYRYDYYLISTCKHDILPFVKYLTSLHTLEQKIEMYKKLLGEMLRVKLLFKRYCCIQYCPDLLQVVKHIIKRIGIDPAHMSSFMGVPIFPKLFDYVIRKKYFTDAEICGILGHIFYSLVVIRCDNLENVSYLVRLAKKYQVAIPITKIIKYYPFDYTIIRELRPSYFQLLKCTYTLSDHIHNIYNQDCYDGTIIKIQAYDKYIKLCHYTGWPRLTNWLTKWCMPSCGYKVYMLAQLVQFQFAFFAGWKWNATWCGISLSWLAWVTYYTSD